MASDPIVPYEPPVFVGDAFNCPHCHAFATQVWGVAAFHTKLWPQLRTATCGRCRNRSVWFDGVMIVPPNTTAPHPNTDLPDEIKADYEEARNIAAASPRGACALLRLCIQKLCDHLDVKGKSLNAQIGSLVERGLPVLVQQSLDTVRVAGNNAVHPGELDLKDDTTTANSLFGLVNIIAELMITQPKHVQELYEVIVPGKQRDAIAKRDES